MSRTGMECKRKMKTHSAGRGRNHVVLAMALAQILSLCCVGHASADPITKQGLSGAKVSIVGIVCEASQPAFVAAPSKIPSVFVDMQSMSSPKQTITQFSSSGSAVWFDIDAPAGFHDVLVLSSYGEAEALFDVLPNHDRHIVVSLCGSLPHYDSFRSLSVVLPTEGLAPYLEISREGKTVFRQMTVENGVAYAESLGEGAVALIVRYGSSGICSYQADSGVADWTRQHLRLNLSIDALSVRRSARQCGRLNALSF